MKIMYIRDEKRNPVGVIVYERNKEEHTVKYQYSVCAPSDTFDKKKGLRVASIRLKEISNVVTNAFHAQVTSAHDAMRLIMQDIAHTTKSQRALWFAQYWLEFDALLRGEVELCLHF